MSDIDKHYKEAFGAEFSKLRPEQIAKFDQIVAGASSPEVVYDNGRPTYNPVRRSFDQAVKEHGGIFTKDLAQKLGVYASWRAGLVPGAGEGGISDYARKQAARAGIPVEKLEAIDKERKEAWAGNVLNRFSYLVQPEPDAEKSDKTSTTVDNTKAPVKPLDNPLAVQNTPPPPAAIAAPGVQGGPAPAMAAPRGNELPADEQVPQSTPEDPPQGVTGPAGPVDLERLRQQGGM